MTLACILGTHTCILGTHACILDTHACILGTHACILGTHAFILGTHAFILDNYCPQFRRCVCMPLSEWPGTGIPLENSSADLSGLTGKMTNI